MWSATIPPSDVYQWIALWYAILTGCVVILAVIIGCLMWLSIKKPTRRRAR